jgi:hypothetical protein
VRHTTSLSKRLQVVVRDEDLEAFAGVARIRGLTLSELVRQTLRKAERDVSRGDVQRKLAAIRWAVNYPDRAPAPDIEQMNEEIERGYLSDNSWS